MNFEDMLNQVVKVRVTVSNVDDDEWETGRLADLMINVSNWSSGPGLSPTS